MAKTQRKTDFVLCIEVRDCDDLQKGKVYPVLPDARAKRDNYLRIVDESGEDYLYPASYFVELELPSKAKAALGAEQQELNTFCSLSAAPTGVSPQERKCEEETPRTSGREKENPQISQMPQIKKTDPPWEDLDVGIVRQGKRPASWKSVRRLRIEPRPVFR